MPRVRTSTEHKKKAGNPGKRKLVEQPKIGGDLEAPTWMPEEAQAIWFRLVTYMFDNTYTRLDEGALIAYANAEYMIRKGIHEIETKGAISIGSQGQEIVSPWVRIVSDNSRLLVQLGTRLHLDPVARQAISSPETPKALEMFDIPKAH